MSNNCTPTYPICVVKGSTFRKDFIWRVDGVPVDMTGYTARMQIIRKTDNAVIVDLTTANTKLVITEAEGKTSAVLTHAETRAITETDEGVYAVLLKSPAGDRIKRFRGPVYYEDAEVEDVDA